ncbi:tetratricopeptide repeat protein [Phytoactinopolyspora endophytica]|uniref:tetratricopeptide repeat protein n=1 Tax=Phytoactinopolyspora endophytica TaxID=1642495 RepID=UPI00101C8D02|nr:hypothetical protein [Phytoactinopolyspora endophytica]
MKLLTLQGRAAASRRVFQHIIDTGHQDVAAAAAFHVGRLLAERGDISGAISVYEYAARHGSSLTVDFARLFCAKLRHKQWDLEGALTEFRHVIRSDNKLPAWLATIELQALLADQEMRISHTREHSEDS